MGMDTHVAGFIPPDEAWQKMKAVWDACDAAGIEVPADVEDFFDGESPDPAGQTVEIPHRDWKDSDCEGFEVAVADLPPQVKVIRFWNSW
jgi:hypothetical protein